MKLLWSEDAWEDYVWWQDHDRKTLQKINSLIKAVQREPFTGIGKPEPLKGNLSGWWSRRIRGDHRLVYRVVGEGIHQKIEIIQCRYHY